MTILMQGKTEEIMNNHLEEETETKVHWETELLSYTQNDTCVTSIIRNNNTQEETVIESTYIVGADGSHSRVRKANPDWTYDGASIQTKFALADLTIRGENVKHMMDKMNVFMQGTSKFKDHSLTKSANLLKKKRCNGYDPY
jgi:2-polyprenyl-6-methoxyphenol hydroxylase-like FAD-dependent oxidoreductase